jgi:hypothetical protein
MSPKEVRDRAWSNNGYSLTPVCREKLEEDQTLYNLLRILR